MPSDENTPDFDAMSPEEVMAWMESLAKRQGADASTFTTAADMNIEAIDPDSVDEESLGDYVPHGWTKERWNAYLAQEQASQMSAADDQAPEETNDAQADAEDSPMDWLAALAHGQTPESDLPDLAAAGLDIPDMGDMQLESDEPADPMDWLRALAGEEDEDSELDLSGLEELETSDALVSPLDSGEDPISWLESLAARQDANHEELSTPADLDVPLPTNLEETGPGYTPYSFESPELSETGSSRKTAAELPEPEAWLDSLAGGRADEDSDDEAPAAEEDAVGDVMRRLQEAQDVPPEAISQMFQSLLDRAEAMEAEAETTDEAEAPPVEAEIPDWLQEQLTEASLMAEEAPELIIPEDEELDTIFEDSGEYDIDIDAFFSEEIADEAESAAELPDWLQEGAEPDEDIRSIFAEADESAELPEPAAPAIAASELEAEPPQPKFDTQDSWVVAFEMESNQPDAAREWYEQSLQELEQEQAEEMAPLEPGELPEELELMPGEAEPLPEWLDTVVSQEIESPLPLLPDVETAEVEEAFISMQPFAAQLPTETQDEDVIPDWLKVDESETVSQSLPDWLQDADISPADIPEWLLDTRFDEAAQPAVIAAEAQESAVTVPQPTTSAVSDVLTEARQQISQQNIDGALRAYETIVTSNEGLDAVADDISHLLTDESNQNNPGIYRVLGDCLMRQGQLQQALDTYRKALNLL